MHALTTSGLTKHYQRRRLPLGRAVPPVRALEPLDIAVRQGEIFGFLGPNGAGKSTTIRLLLGYLHPTAGSGQLLGLDIVRDSVAIRRRVGYLPGGIALLRHPDRRARARVPGGTERPAADSTRGVVRSARVVSADAAPSRS